MIVPTATQHSVVSPLSKLTPATRLICGVTLLMTTLIVPVDNWRLTLLPVALVIGWTLLCKVHVKHLAYALLLAVGMFSPYLLLAPYTHYKTGVSWFEAIKPPLVIGLRGTLSLMACLATYITLNATELREALHTLPIPRIMGALILQIAHQTAMLKDETSRMLAAYKLRGITTSGLRLRMRCLCASPVLWLLRLTMRAERVGDAMELRGFTETTYTCSENKPGVSDTLIRIIAFLILLFTIILSITVKL